MGQHQIDGLASVGVEGWDLAEGGDEEGVAGYVDAT